MKNSQSKLIFDRLKKSIPGGVNSPVRAFQNVDSEPLVIDSGKGAIVKDVDGNSYIDFVGSWGPLILGHAHPEIIGSVNKTAKNGTSFGASTLLEAELAEMIINAINSVELVRFVNSGTEATMSAVRLARAFTNKNIIVKFEGCYHGHSDLFLSKSGSGVAELDEPSSAGILDNTIVDSITIPYNDINAVESVYNEYGGNIAAVIVEPIAGNMGVVLPQDTFLKSLRKLTSKNDSLLIFDEVITGFRVNYGGAQTYFDITPDITCLGKIIGGGFPVGAFGGKREIMEMIAPLGPVYQAGTLSGNPVAMSAGITTLNILNNPNIYTKLESKGAYLSNKLKKVFLNSEVEIQIPRCGSMFSLFFSPKIVSNWNDITLHHISYYKKFHFEMLRKGIYIPPSPFETFFISTKHTKNELDYFVDSVTEILKTGKYSDN